MLKHIIAIILLSIVIILGLSYVKTGLHYLIVAHDWISNSLTQIFSSGFAGNLVKELIALLVVPLIAAFIPAIIYRLARHQWFPYFMQVMWVVWLAETSAWVVLHKAAGV